MDKPCVQEHEFFDQNGSPKYTEIRRCKYYWSNFTSKDSKHSCPHQWQYCKESQKCLPGNWRDSNWPCLKDQCTGQDWHFCSKSEKCIPKAWLCDGSVQCPIDAEDEDFDLCTKNPNRTIFAQGATIQCIENNRPDRFQITILAKPCDGIIECLDKSDEECGENIANFLYIIALVFVVIIGAIWLWLYKMVEVRNDNEPNNDQHASILQTEWNPKFRKKLKGNTLADLKVCALE